MGGRGGGGGGACSLLAGRCSFLALNSDMMSTIDLVEDTCDETGNASG